METSVRYYSQVSNGGFTQSSTEFKPEIGNHFNAFKEFERSSNQTKLKIEYNPHVLNAIRRKRGSIKYRETFKIPTHKERIANLKPLVFDMCSMAFRHKKNLINHIRDNTEKVTYSCNKCDKTFSELGNLQKHMYTHEKDKLFLLNVCGKSFYSKYNFLKPRHCRTNLYECDNLKKHCGNEEQGSRYFLTPERLKKNCPQVFNGGIPQSSKEFKTEIGLHFNAFKEFEQSSNQTKLKIEYNPDVLNGILRKSDSLNASGFLEFQHSISGA